MKNKDTKNKNIENEIAYFNKIIKNMDNKEYEKEKAKKDAGFIECELIPSEIENICCTVDEYFCGNLLECVEMSENTDLHKTLKSLSAEEQTILNYLYYKCKTQNEVARIFKLSQSNLSRKHTNIINKMKNYLFNR